MWYVLSTVRERKARFSPVYASSLLATTISPEVPTSSRWTMPWRSGTPEVEIRKPAATRCPSTVGPLQPTLGWAATPTGLSTTTMSSSSYTIVRPGAVIGCTTADRGSDSVTSSIAPDADPVGLGRNCAVQQHPTVDHQVGDPAAGQPEHPRDRSVDPLPLQPLGDQQHPALTHGPGLRRGRRREPAQPPQDSRSGRSVASSAGSGDCRPGSVVVAVPPAATASRV